MKQKIIYKIIALTGILGVSAFAWAGNYHSCNDSNPISTSQRQCDKCPQRIYVDGKCILCPNGTTWVCSDVGSECGCGEPCSSGYTVCHAGTCICSDDPHTAGGYICEYDELTMHTVLTFYGFDGEVSRPGCENEDEYCTGPSGEPHIYESLAKAREVYCHTPTTNNNLYYCYEGTLVLLSDDWAKEVATYPCAHCTTLPDNPSGEPRPFAGLDDAQARLCSGTDDNGGNTYDPCTGYYGKSCTDGQEDDGGRCACGPNPNEGGAPVWYCEHTSCWQPTNYSSCDCESEVSNTVGTCQCVYHPDHPGTGCIWSCAD